MTDPCPDNSTACLLRAILDAQSKQSGFNWDPLNFAFTAAIGVLALVVAGTTVFQGLLSAGPGRLKASKAAIGRYASRTKTTFDWNELRYQTTATVPFLNSLQFISSKRVPQEGESNSGRWFGLAKILESKPRLSSPEFGVLSRPTAESGYLNEPIKSYPARWVTLLESAGLDASNVTNQKIITDHLPADVAAAPAWATVRVAVTIAVMAGCNVVTINSDSRYPLVRGPTCQLRFREHPDLGTVAVFDALVKERQYPFYAVDMPEIIRENDHGPVCYLTSYSFTYLWPHIMREDLIRRCACSYSVCNDVFEVTTQDNQIRVGRYLAALVLRSPISSRVANLNTNNILGTSNFLQTLMTLVEHCGKTQAGEHIRDLSAYAADIGVSHWYNSEDFENDKERGIASREKPDLGWSWLYDVPKDSHRRPRMDLPFPQSGDMPRIVLNVLLRCILLCEGEVLQESSGYIPRFRRLLQFQLQELDWWLLNHGGSMAACKTLAMVNHTITQEHIKKVNFAVPSISDLFDPQQPITLDESARTSDTQTDEPTRVPIETEEKRKRELRKILLFRAAVWTAYLHTAADISSVLEGELGERIVQLL